MLNILSFNISDSVSDDAALILTNAVHFREAWDAAFDELPDRLDFYLANGQVTKVKMMVRASYQIGLARFHFTKVVPDMPMTLASIKYSVKSH
jgi:serine protease inhibitor